MYIFLAESFSPKPLISPKPYISSELRVWGVLRVSLLRDGSGVSKVWGVLVSRAQGSGSCQFACVDPKP